MVPLPEDTAELLRIDTRFESGLSWKKRPSPKAPVNPGSKAGRYNTKEQIYEVCIRGDFFDAQRIRMFLRDGVDPGDVDYRRRHQEIPEEIYQFC